MVMLFISPLGGTVLNQNKTDICTIIRVGAFTLPPKKRKTVYMSSSYSFHVLRATTAISCFHIVL